MPPLLCLSNFAKKKGKFTKLELKFILKTVRTELSFLI